MNVDIELHRDAAHANRIVNHPDVIEWVRGAAVGEIDLTALVSSEHTYVLMGEHGGQIYIRRQPGLFEIHSQFTPEGRGAWARAVTQKSIHWMFTKTEAVEIMTLCPKGNLGAKAMARAVGASREFTNPRGWVMAGETIPADVYRLTIQDWLRTAPGLAQRGAWFHDRLEQELGRLGAAHLAHDDDETHDRYAGAACDMILSGQVLKGIAIYNRFAMFGGYQAIALRSVDPVTIDIGNAVLQVADNDFTVVGLKTEMGAG